MKLGAHALPCALPLQLAGHGPRHACRCAFTDPDNAFPPTFARTNTSNPPYSAHIARQARRQAPIAATATDYDDFDDWLPFPSPSEPSTPKASCYGCGVGLQVDDSLAPGFVEIERLELKRRHRQQNTLLCARCQALSNGAMIPGVADFQQLKSAADASSPSLGFNAKALATPDQLRDQLKEVRSSRALVVLLVDLLDASGSLLGRVRDLVGGNPIIAIGTKADLLPAGFDTDEVEEWLIGALAFKKISVDSVHIVSARTGDGVAQAVGALRRARLGRDVYVMGAANVGKSSFVRSLVKDMSSMRSRQYDPLAPGAAKHLPVESAMPGTTLRTIPLQVFSSGGTLYDTPGLHLHHRVPHILSPQENKELHPRKRLRGFVTPPIDQPGSETEEEPLISYSWGGLARFDVLECPPGTRLVFYGPAALRVAAMGDTEGEAFGAASVEARGGLRPVREVALPVESGAFEAVGDVAVSGVPGWVTVVAGPVRRGLKDTVRLRVWAPVGTEAYARPPLPVPLPERVFEI
jgi:nitric-oxide synthase